jgi:hypothetical protein
MPVRAVDTLREAFAKRCSAAEESIRIHADYERRMGVHNFDSGIPVEDLVRDEFRRLLPSRYSVRSGIVVDATGYTAGQCDVVVFNDLWFPVVKAGPVESSRHHILPIEGAYAIGEVKQTLDEATLDEAMKKLVMCHRLERPETFAHRLVENREHCNCVHGLANPLYTFVFAVNLKEGVTFESLINRFFDISKKLRRLDVVRALCVLGHGTVVWGYEDPSDPSGSSTSPARFIEEDLFKPIYPVYFRADETTPASYALISNLLMHLFHSVLAPEDFAVNYGPLRPPSSVPTDRTKIALSPDAEWVERLSTPCSSRH